MDDGIGPGWNGLRRRCGTWRALGDRRASCGASAGGVVSKKTVSAKTWTETSPRLDAQVVLTRRAGAEACRQVATSTAAKMHDVLWARAVDVGYNCTWL